MMWKLITVFGVLLCLVVAGCSGSGSESSATTEPAIVVVSASDATLMDSAGTTGAPADSSGMEVATTMQESESVSGVSAGSTSTGVVSGEAADEGGVTAGSASTDSGSDDSTTEGGVNSVATTTGVGSGGASTEGGVSSGTTSAGVATTGSTADGGASDGSTTDATTESPYPAGSLADVLDNNGDAGIALAALRDAGLDLALNDIGNAWTVFLPTDEAIAADPLFDIQRHIHVADALEETILSNFNGAALLMNNGENLTVIGGGDLPLKIGNASVIASDLMGNTSPVIVHIIDTVITEDASSLYPEGSLADVLNDSGNVGRALAAFRAAGLDLSINDVENEWTVFMPDDDALESVSDFDPVSHIYTTAILTGEQLEGLSGSQLDLAGGNSVAIEGGGLLPLSVGGALVMENDVVGNSNLTIVHIIDAVLE